MKTAIEVLTKVLEDSAESFSRQAKSVGKMVKLVQGLTFEDDRTRLSCYGSTLSISVFTREDLQAAMGLLPGMWKKSPGYDGSLEYTNSRGEYDTDDRVAVEITAYEDALPKTCQVVEEVVVQAAQPERTYTRKVVKCYTGVEGADTAVSEVSEVEAEGT